ncbi:enoyl-CoA hydratase-related protein [Gynuella sunshinyii]|uniref:Methionyl-tRNA formyltransferase n=1 Tax=Gynuella sunshinyii YC6258 TaxID=1445510 RepID=A0A0C5VF32_9GAMM|nr:enoyl-CoA hydratase-related protein [Gynuella sunshinyii]AJQ92746.1 methionyl-tRNA formyltransferase [Gynuella sunshinyii YC6258]
MKVLILASAFSGLTQRVFKELLLLGHVVEQHYDLDEIILRDQVSQFEPDIIICPFLTQRIPEDIWRQYLCLVIHPGIEGDRGPSSLDWAIIEHKPQWGVTLLQADAEMDSGDIWDTRVFALREASKLSVYKREVSSAAVDMIKSTLRNIEQQQINPRPLDYTNPKVKGKLRPLMKREIRAIDWQSDASEVVVRKMNSADTSPGVLISLYDYPVYLYGASEDTSHTGHPGDIIAVYKDAVCFACATGSVWIQQMKCKQHPRLPAIKLPAAQVVQHLLPVHAWSAVNTEPGNCVAEDIYSERDGEVTYLYFNFYNGAMSTRQCHDLKNALVSIKQTDTKYIVLMGGEDFWSNGIHLNCIEAAADPAEESWQNINAINDLVLEIIDSPDHMTIAALRNNAGAGGVIAALACDEVIIRDGVVLNPHYQRMGLYGSEYWTYLLPAKVGHRQAQKITLDCEPMLAAEAFEIGLADTVFPEEWQAFHDHLKVYCRELTRQVDLPAFLSNKRQQRQHDESIKPLTQYRAEELQEMKRIFDDSGSRYHQERRAFVYKQKGHPVATRPDASYGADPLREPADTSEYSPLLSTAGSGA